MEDHWKKVSNMRSFKIRMTLILITVSSSTLRKVAWKKQKHEDVEEFKEERLLKATEERKSMKKFIRDLLLYRNNLKALKDKNGNTIKSREGMEAICK
ncbi:hypothetical protein ANCDUO_03762 [Ancylostoma duodenale]|uniref:Uncharacterized protein n=1 Tax=Ancylostoma duodenale TaxID=51022 RepID=A0A0C2DT33_9BILA|nr:hypothetical protein ANCDUO_03762 [Ancylostoma duodenale]